MLEGLVTDQARLVAATPELLEAELASVADLEFLLAAAVSRDWPPAGWDRTTISWLRHRLREHPDELGWWASYLVSLDEVVVGTVGLKGKPRDGEVEIGYGLVPSAFGMGYATTVVRAIVDEARRRPDIGRIVARVDPAAPAAVAVVHRAGFEVDATGQRTGDRAGEERYVIAVDD